MAGLRGIPHFLRSCCTRVIIAVLAIFDETFAPAVAAFFSIVVSSFLHVFQRARSILRWAFYNTGVDTLKNVPAECVDTERSANPSVPHVRTAPSTESGSSTASEWSLTRHLSRLHLLQPMKQLSTVIAGGLWFLYERYLPLDPNPEQTNKPSYLTPHQSLTNKIPAQSGDTAAVEVKGIATDRTTDSSKEAITKSALSFHYSDAGDDMAVPAAREAAAAAAAVHAPPFVCTCKCAAASARLLPVHSLVPAAIASSPTDDKKEEVLFQPGSFKSQDVVHKVPDKGKDFSWLLLLDVAVMLCIILLSGGVLRILTKRTSPVPISAIDTRVVSPAAVLETARIDELPAAYISVSVTNTDYVDNAGDEDSGSHSNCYSTDSIADTPHYEVVSAADRILVEEMEVVPQSTIMHDEAREMNLSRRELYHAQHVSEYVTIVSDQPPVSEESSPERHRSKSSFRHYKSPGVSGARERELDALIQELKLEQEEEEIHPDDYVTADFESEDIKQMVDTITAIVEDNSPLTIPLLHSIALCAAGLDILGIDSGGFHRLNACIKNEMLSYEKQGDLDSFYQIDAYDMRKNDFWSTYNIKYSTHCEYVKKALQDAVRFVQSLLPRMIELWESFATCFENSLINSFAFFNF